MKINNKQKIRIVVVTVFSVSFLASAFKLSNINIDDKKEITETIAYGKTHLSKILYDNMLDRKESLKIHYVNDDYKEVFEDIKNEKTIEYIASIDDINTSDDYDYLLYNLEGIETNVINNGSLNTTFDMVFNWRESKEETEKVNKEIKRIITELNLEEKSDYEKIKIIHNKIAENVSYNKSLDHKTAYNALFDGSATCQGYSMLFYKFMTELNIPCKYITGIGISEDSGEHGWNIVKLGDKWYNIDVTWDDPIHYNADGSSSEENKIIYDNFLKGSKEFNIKHKKDKKFETEEFVLQFPISETNYKKTIEEPKSSPKGFIPDWSEIEKEKEEYEKKVEIDDKEVIITNPTTYKYVYGNIKEKVSGKIKENGYKDGSINIWNKLDTIGKIAIIFSIISIIIMLTPIFRY